jgi:hypothetical protein
MTLSRRMRTPAYCADCHRRFANKYARAAHLDAEGRCTDVRTAPGWHAIMSYGCPLWRHEPHPRLPVGRDDVDPSRCPPWIAR